MLKYSEFPKQQLPFSKKGKEWRKQHLDWAEQKIFFDGSPIRHSLLRKKVNIDLVNNILDMKDLALVLNPDKIDAQYLPDTIQHYPIMNSKLGVLRGEELNRRFNFRSIVTNPNAISALETNKKQELLARLEEVISNQGLSEEETAQAVEELQYHFIYEWQDMREIRANYLLKHYIKEYNMQLMFNTGFMYALTVGEEIYKCDIVSGEPVIELLNPAKTVALMSGYSNRIEDADVVILADYWSRGKIIDTFYDVLTPQEIKAIESYLTTTPNEVGERDETKGFLYSSDVNYNNSIIDNFLGLATSLSEVSTNPIDNYGNIRVLRLYWKSRRKIKKIKSYDLETGQEIYSFQTEHYVINPDLGEEETILWINEAWEATKIGQGVYLQMRPRPVQYNRMSNPSRCHFGIVGTIYNFGDSKPVSLVDLMKPFSYLYDVIRDRLNKAIASNWGKILKIDLALIPKGWTVDKWMYYARVNSVAVYDSFKEGNVGAATGKLAGFMPNQSSGALDLETGNYIQQHIMLLEAIKQEMAEVAGISKQREGQISNRETVGGVERATLQSSHITEAYFAYHDNTKQRALECFLETAKIALKGDIRKFQYILPDSSTQIIEIDGDDFADADYGIVIDGSPETEKLEGALQQIAQAAMQSGTMTFSSIIKVLSSPSMAEIQRLIERDEREVRQRQSESAQAEQEAAQQELEVTAQIKQAELELKQYEVDMRDLANQRDNETKLLLADLASQDPDNDGIIQSNLKREELLEKIRQFDKSLAFDKEKLEKELAVKRQALTKRANSSK